MKTTFQLYKDAWTSHWQNRETRPQLEVAIQKFVLYILISLLASISLYKFLIQENKIVYQNIHTSFTYYSEELHKANGLLSKKALQEATVENQKNTVGKTIQDIEIQYDQILPSTYSIPLLLTLLEDFTSSLSEANDPLVLRGINFENQHKAVYIPSSSLQHKSSITFPREDIEAIISNSNNPEYRGLFTLTPTHVIFHKEITQSMFEVFKDPEERERIQTLYNTIEKSTIPAVYKEHKFNVTIEGTQKKLFQFMSFIHNSGNTEKYFFRNKIVPLMTLEAFSYPLHLSKNLNGEEAPQTVQISLKAYSFPNPEEQKAAEIEYNKNNSNTKKP